MKTAIMILVVMGTVGLTFGFILAFANKKFAIEVNPLIHIVEDVLPKGQCGACGYAGCMAYAEAVVLKEDVSPNLCVPGKEEVAKLVAELTGKTAAKIEPRSAHIKCAGSINKSIQKYNYNGVEDCFAASLLLGGPKVCEYGCVGLGTCVKNCPFDAIVMSEDKLPIIDTEKCTGCGKCESDCPKNVIQMSPVGAHVRVNCNSKDKGAIAKKACSVACIGCRICAKNCTYDAINIENNLAIVNSNICIEQCSEKKCLDKCPTGAIKPAIGGVVPGKEIEGSLA